MELISKDAVWKIIDDAYKTWKPNDINIKVRYCLDNISASIEDLPVIAETKIESRPKGKWIAEYTDIRGYTTSFQCSNCYRVIVCPSLIKAEQMDYDYCPYCGAEMRGKE